MSDRARRILVAVDDSDSAQRAVQWCAEYARAGAAEVVVLHAVQGPDYERKIAGFLVPPLSDERMAEIAKAVETEWCQPLIEAEVPFEVQVVQGLPAPATIDAAEAHGVDLVVTGRRGHGGKTRLHLGSTSTQLAHNLARPLVIVP